MNIAVLLGNRAAVVKLPFLIHTAQLISIIEVSQHHNRVALMWLICDNQCKLVQENP